MRDPAINPPHRPNPDTVPMLMQPPAILLAGGQGTRLHELTQRDCKPALPFGPVRIIDFTLSALRRAGTPCVVVPTQYRPQSLEAHLAEQWGRLYPGWASPLRGSGAGFSGTVAAALAALRQLPDCLAPEVIIAAGDHVHAVDFAAMVRAHRASGAPLTVAALPVPVQEAGGFGVFTLAADGRVTNFHEKPAVPARITDMPGHAMASLGIYVVDRGWLQSVTANLAARLTADLDFGTHVLPAALSMGALAVHRATNCAGAAPYWRDVGTLDAYRLAALDFIGAAPVPLPMTAMDGAGLPHSVAGLPLSLPGVVLVSPRLNPQDAGRWGVLQDSVVMRGGRVQHGVRLRNVIVAPGTTVPAGMVIGDDPQEDARWFRTTPGGTILVTSAMLARRAASQPRPSLLPTLFRREPRHA